jgi:hypothetical protein
MCSHHKRAVAVHLQCIPCPPIHLQAASFLGLDSRQTIWRGSRHPQPVGFGLSSQCPTSSLASVYAPSTVKDSPSPWLGSTTGSPRQSSAMPPARKAKAHRCTSLPLSRGTAPSAWPRSYPEAANDARPSFFPIAPCPTGWLVPWEGSIPGIVGQAKSLYVVGEAVKQGRGA